MDEELNMKEALKKLIEEAPIRRVGAFVNFLIVPTGQKYDGFWGENGYNEIVLLGLADDGKYYNITDSADSVMFSKVMHVNFDIPSEYNCVRFWFDEPIQINNEMNLSTLMGYPEGSMDV